MDLLRFPGPKEERSIEFLERTKGESRPARSEVSVVSGHGTEYDYTAGDGNSLSDGLPSIPPFSALRSMDRQPIKRNLCFIIALLKTGIDLSQQWIT